MNSHDIALSAFSIRNMEEALVQSTQEKLNKALEFLGSKHVLAKKVKRLKLKKRSY